MSEHGGRPKRDMLIPGRWRRAARPVAPHHAGIPAAPAAEPDLAEAARQLLGERQRRADLFGQDLFADPAWEILLELFLAGEMNVRAPLTRVGTVAGVPTMAARRWIEVLVERDLVRKLPDRDVPERVLVDLTPDAHEEMRRYLLEMFV